MKRTRSNGKTVTTRFKKARAGTKANPIIISDAQIRRAMNVRTGGYSGIEWNFFDCSRSAGLVSTADSAGGEIDPTTLNCLNCPAQGTGETSRLGRQITMGSIYVKGMVNISQQSNQTATDIIPTVMIALVLDKQTNGAQLNSEDVYTNQSGFSTLAPMPMRNLENIQRFQVLKTVRIGPQEIAGSIQPVYDGTNIEQMGANVPFEMYVNLKNMKVNFISGETGSSVSAIADNSLHLVAFCSNVGTAPSVLYNSRLRFKP